MILERWLGKMRLNETKESQQDIILKQAWRQELVFIIDPTRCPVIKELNELHLVENNIVPEITVEYSFADSRNRYVCNIYAGLEQGYTKRLVDTVTISGTNTSGRKIMTKQVVGIFQEMICQMIEKETVLWYEPLYDLADERIDEFLNELLRE